MVLYVYDGLSYPGIILPVDEDYVEVKTMSRVGRNTSNRWFWPMRDDVLWYDRKSIITLLDEEPVHVTKRHLKINDDIWAAVESALE
ncbi:hypothetical protein DPMN_098083 [Dreissena polymorpha]|uniref:Uncharacterized protein n=1 Tax=Dreissena polymorpha TaxID=45954 RepID=A0A9D4LBG5_DREPO|nr:hypothetical protein DPMN_098054 [Dreissena polymorpha]KAH3855515.1 hypothetical protein DPMN_098083 [Dreissena polymorpha]